MVLYHSLCRLAHDVHEQVRIYPCSFQFHQPCLQFYDPVHAFGGSLILHVVKLLILNILEGCSQSIVNPRAGPDPLCAAYVDPVSAHPPVILL